MNIDISICDLQLLSISLPLIFNFHAGFNALSTYDEVSTCVMFYSVDINLVLFSFSSATECNFKNSETF